MDELEYYEDLDDDTRAAIEHVDSQPGIPQVEAEQRILKLKAKN